MLLALPPALDMPGYRLARWEPRHAGALRAALAASDAHLRPWTPWVIDGKVAGLTIEERLARHEADFTAGREWVYGLFTADESEVLGGCGLYPRVGPRAVELGYWLAAGHTGRGLATDSAATLTALAFASPGVERVEIRCDPRNTASARVPERLGFTHAHTLPATATSPALMVWTVASDTFGTAPREPASP